MYNLLDENIILEGNATVTFEGLDCGTFYDITAAGMFSNDTMDGTASSLGNFTTMPCPSEKAIQEHVLYSREDSF